MLRRLAVFLVLATAPALARAQDRPLSPPARPPVPMTAEDQRRTMEEELLKQKQADASRAAAAARAKAASSARPADAAHADHISSGNAAIDAVVEEAARLHRLDPCLIFSVMRAESGFNRGAVSRKGASGLMQLMPATAARFGVKNIFDTRENILGGSRYLRWLLDRFSGDVRLALAGYNAGEGAVEFYKNRIPPFAETQNYVRTIYSRYSRIHSSAAQETAASLTAMSAGAATTAAVKERIPTYNQIIRSTSDSGDIARTAQ